jgi:hypothetical protein
VCSARRRRRRWSCASASRPGFHINSHTPKDELLIPTELKLDSRGGVIVLGEQYPKGSAFRLVIGNGETLDVYQGEFRVTVRLTAAQGASLLTGSLRYQACDNAACFPPKSLPKDRLTALPGLLTAQPVFRQDAAVQDHAEGAKVSRRPR